MRVVSKLTNKINVDDNTVVRVENYNSFFAKLSQVLDHTPPKFVDGIVIKISINI